jgi:hypothetical protein
MQYALLSAEGRAPIGGPEPLHALPGQRATCAVDRCDRPARGKGLCDGHYTRQRLGRPLDGAIRPRRSPGATNDVCGHFDRPHSAHGMCSPCDKRRQHINDPEARRRRKRECDWRRWGIDVSEATKVRGLRRCEICVTTERLRVDHNHTTKRVRGCLCNGCNRGLGYFGDDPALLERAAAYLRERDGLQEVV